MIRSDIARNGSEGFRADETMKWGEGNSFESGMSTCFHRETVFCVKSKRDLENAMKKREFN